MTVASLTRGTRACPGWPMPAAHATPPRTIWSKATTESVANARHRLAVPARPSDAVCGSCNLVGSASHPNPAFYAPTGRPLLWPSLSTPRPCWLTINAAQPPLIGLVEVFLVAGNWQTMGSSFLVG
ncbi:hypothetical protein V8C42DRAFT_308757 [Trichoderma barbatum]